MQVQPSNRRRDVILSAALGGALIVCIIAVGVLARVLGDVTRSTTPSSSLQPSGLLGSALQTATARAAPPATITPTAPPAQPVTGAYLGGPIADWLARYGSTNSGATQQAVYQWKGAIAGHAVQLTVNVSLPADALDGHSRVVIIDITGPNRPNTPWSASVDAALVAPFLPPDAVHQQDLAATAATGPDHLYRSSALAASLTASLFQSAETGAPLLPGTFDWICSTQQPACEIAAGAES